MGLIVSTVFVALADCEGALVAFYTALFAQKPEVYIPQVYAEFRLPGLRLGIFKPKLDQQDQFGGRSGSMSLCVEVQQLEPAIEHLKTLGYPPTGGIITASHGREIYAYDPAGNRLILHDKANMVI